jgi:hypothetical protein
MRYKLSLIDDVDIDGIDMRDYPDFCDAFIGSADYDGKPMTDDQLDELNQQIISDSETTDWFYDKVWNAIH